MHEHRHPMCQQFIVALLLAALALSGCKTVSHPSPEGFSHFVGLSDFSKFTRTENKEGETVLLSPEINSVIPWNELIVSWNADAPAGTFLKLEARAHVSGGATKYFELGHWSINSALFPRTSISGQTDANGTVNTDTLVLTQPARTTQVRV